MKPCASRCYLRLGLPRSCGGPVKEFGDGDAELRRDLLEVVEVERERSVETPGQRRLGYPEFPGEFSVCNMLPGHFRADLTGYTLSERPLHREMTTPLACECQEMVSCILAARNLCSRGMSRADVEAAMGPDELIAAEVRAEMARQRVTQTELAREVFDTYAQFIQARVSGRVPFGAWELVRVADYLGVDVVKFLSAPKRRPPGDTPGNGDDLAATGSLDFHGSTSYDVGGYEPRGNAALRAAA